MFLGCVLIAYWLMRATGHLDAMGTPGGLITGTGASRQPGGRAGGRGSAGGQAGAGAGDSTGGGSGGAGGTGAPPAGGWQSSSRPAAAARRRLRQAKPFGSSTGKRGPVAWITDRIEDAVDYGSDAVTAAKRRRERELRQAEYDRKRWESQRDHRTARQRRSDRRATCPACGHLPVDRELGEAKDCGCTECACGVQNQPRTPDGAAPNGGQRDLGRTGDPPAQPTPTPKGGDGADHPTSPTDTTPAAPAATTEGDTVTAPTTTNANVDRDAASIPAFYRLVNQFVADLAAMGEGLSAKDMDPASLAEFVELQEHATTVENNVHMRHGNLLAAHQEAQHAAHRDAYLDQSA